MRQWILIDPAGEESLHALARAAVEVFRSGDRDEPEPGDLQDAIETLLARREIPLPEDGSSVPLILIPLSEAERLDVVPTSRFDIRSRGGVSV